jgi:hypothetical protein
MLLLILVTQIWAKVNTETLWVFQETPKVEQKQLFVWDLVLGDTIDFLLYGDSVQVLEERNGLKGTVWNLVRYADISWDTVEIERPERVEVIRKIICKEGWVLGRFKHYRFLLMTEKEEKSWISFGLLYGQSGDITGMLKVNNQLDMRLWGMIVLVIVIGEFFLCFRFVKMKKEQYKLWVFLVLVGVTLVCSGLARMEELIILWRGKI